MEERRELTDFPVKLELRIDWAELDLFGHVNNTMFLKYAQAARVNYWEQIGLYQHFLATKQGPILANVSCRFHKPLFYPGGVTVYTGMKHIGTTSFSFQHQVVNDQGELTAEVEDLIVMYDFNENVKMPFPAAFREKVEELEGKKF